ncbi:MarR family winged helix-turn-helix transcriptional regulator [Klenkia terrae]|uniref:MarR family transcriptional regulator n=1 Tax=Klenkia terrae TaxID=1052259 RepID=A0ABU8E9M8_9ACTN|nr:MarR family transcriptional regulator [Klenkia terrae]
MTPPADRDARVGDVALQVLAVVQDIEQRWGEVLLRGGLTGTQLTLLRSMVDHGPTALDAVAAHLHCDRAMAEVAVDRLTARGLVRRAPDGRVEIAPRGSHFVGEVWAEMAARTSVGRLDDEQPAQLSELLTLMVGPPNA